MMEDVLIRYILQHNKRAIDKVLGKQKIVPYE